MSITTPTREELETKIALLEKENEKYQRVLKGANDGWWHWDLVTDELEYSDRWWHMLGYQPNELTNTSSLWRDLTHPDDVERIVAFFTDFLASTSENYEAEFRLLHKDNYYLPVLSKGFVSRDKNGKPLTVSGINIHLTNRKKAEQELIKAKEKAEENEQYLSEIYRNSGLSIFVVDVSKNSEFRFEGINPTHETLMGIKNEDIVGKTPDELVYHFGQETIDYVNALYKECIEKQTTLVSEFYIPDGAAKGWWLSRLTPIKDQKSGKITKLMGGSIGISERKIMENELKAAKERAEESERNYKLIFNSTGTSNAIIDLDGRVILQNQQSVEALGKDGTGLNVFELFGEKLGTIVSERIKRIVSTGVSETFETEVDMPTGTHWFRSIYHPMKNDDNQINAIQVISQNITELRKVESELIKAKEKAEFISNRFTTIFEQAPLGIALIDSYTGFIYEVNAKFAEIAGRTIEQIKTLNWMSITHPDDIEADLNNMKLLNEGKIQGFNMQKRYIKPNGETVWFNMTIAPVMVEAAEGRKHLSMIEDITERKIYEDNLKTAKEAAEENEKKFRNLLQFSPIPMAVAKNNGDLIFLNNQFIETYGYTMNDIPTIQKWFETVYPDTNYRNTVINEWSQGVEFAIKNNTSTPVYEWLVTCKNTEVKTVEISAFFVKDYAIGIFQDTTTKKRAELQLKEKNEELEKAKEKAEKSEFKYQKLLESTLIGYWLLDTKGTFIDVNPAYCNLTGYTKEEILNLTLSDIEANETTEEIQKHAKKIIDTGYDRFETMHRKKDGTIFPVEVNATFINLYGGLFIVFVDDISKRKQYEYNLLEAKERAEASEIRLKEAQTAAKIGNWQTDLSTLDVIWSSETYKIFELDEQTFKASHPAFLEFVHPDDKKMVDDAFFNSFSTDNYNYIDHRIITANGNLKYVEERWKIIKDVTGKPILAFGTCQDISERKKAEHEIILNKQKAEESDKLKTAFLQNLSHEIRTPLNAISGFTQMLSKPNLSEEKKNTYISIIQNSSDQLISIVTDILTVSALETKQESVDIEPVNINTIVIELLAIFNNQSKNQNVSLFARQQLNDHLAEIYTDKTKLTQILSNLLSNALKFTHVGSIEFGYQLINNEIEFYVKDSGIGIQTDLHDKIFERFRQANASISKDYGGTGLGLSICKGFVELLGGKIWVQSTPAQGSTFYFTIPYKPVHETTAENASEQEHNKKTTILVAEDEEFNFLLIEELLLDFNFNLIHAKNGKEAVEFCKANPYIDLVLMDIKMPIMDGHEAAKTIKQEKPQLPIIAQSAYAMENERAKYGNVFDDYLTKPINEHLLKQKIIKHLVAKNANH